ncbi:BI1-like protein isoform X2 [Macadamia integrifolia]|uniref:BI1-like protein isoform X2 n=1 Tax=Macadamia integrifolia TaxID=60698 RepID=UPI001C5297C5|nr:BI1-like protein isoform X2 [Macadamia integrifolia]
MNELRWGFIRKVYVILAAQIVFTIIVSSLTILYSPINQLVGAISGLFFVFACLPLILFWPLYIYHQKHPLNFIFLGLFAASLSISVEVECANIEGKVVLEALILTSSVVSTLTCYTFWASRKRNQDFNYLEPILFSSLVVLVLLYFLSLIMQMFFPSLGLTLSVPVYNGALGAMVFSGYIIYHTDNLIKRSTYEQYILASALLYWDIVYLSLSILRVLKGIYAMSDGGAPLHRA